MLTYSVPLSIFIIPITLALPLIPNLQTKCYGRYGDINIGILASTTKPGRDGGDMCSEDIYPIELAMAEAAVWAIKKINEDKEILPNITLGYVVLNTCNKDLAAMAQTLFLVPNTCDNPTMQRFGEVCSGKSQTKFEVFGVVGPGSSRMAVLTASVLGLFQIPSISPQATSDVLSDKSLYEYFLRVVPPDKFQVDTIMSFLERMEWSYASLLYSEGSYGENAGRKVLAVSKEKGICFAVSLMLPAIMDDSMMREVIEQLLEKSDARAVVVFINDLHQTLLFREIERRHLMGKFIIVAGDYMYYYHHGFPAAGAFVITFQGAKLPKFRKHYNSLSPVEDGNVWLKLLWEKTYGCEWIFNASRSCYRIASENKADFEVTDLISLYIDAANAHAFAVHEMYSKECPEVFRDKSQISNCHKKTLYLEYLKNISFEGLTGRVEFDEFGDSEARYLLTQYVPVDGNKYIFKPIANVDFLSGRFDIRHNEIDWTLLSRGQFPLEGIPESVCSKPCKNKEFAVRQELICCWDCRTCRDNEILSENRTGCEKCPLLFWPDEETQTLCQPIPPVFLQWTETSGVILMIGSSLGISLCFASYAWLVKFWNEKLVKATSRSLTSITLVGCLLAFCTTFSFIARPSQGSCLVSRFGFGISISIIFAPLLVKTNRVYRIFNAGKKGSGKPAFITNRSQLIIVVLLVTIQIASSTVALILAPPIAAMEMKVPTEQFVEAYCDFPLVGLIPPLTVNITFILSCMLFGFLTRKLPENFNETWYIFVSGSTTMFLWVVFLPTFFTTFYAVHKALLLAACLIINGIITILCLFVPKMYAMKFIDEESQNIKMAGSTVGATIGTVG